MSLLSRDQLAIAIYPERVVWLSVSRGLRPKVSAKGMVSCAAETSTSWHGALAALPKVLKTAEAEGKDVSILLSNKLVRYAVVPNPDSTNSREELDALTRHVFERTHGDVARSWETTLSDAAAGQSALASAVDQGLLLAVRESVKASGARLRAIQPYLMAAFNKQASRMPDGSGLFVVVEPERLCQVSWKAGGWCGVQQMHVNSHWLDALDDVLERTNIGHELQATNARLCAPEFDLSPATHGNKQVETGFPEWPAGLSPVNDRHYAGAMLVLS